MGVYSALDKLTGGFLPGASTPKDVRYRDTILGKATGAASAATLGTLGAAGSLLRLRPDLVDDSFKGAYALGRTGQTRTPNFTAGDAAKSTADLFTPDHLYRFNNQAARDNPGTQNGNVLPEGILPDAIEPDLKMLGIYALAALAIAGNLK